MRVVALEVNAQGKLVPKDVPGVSGLFFIYGDHLGSTTMLGTSGGAFVAGSLTRYRPYGSYRTAPTQTITDRDFTGQRENRELGLLYYNARFYHPASGRFISPDTLVPDPANPQQFNRYTYSLNSPLNYSDPTGHCAETGDDGCWGWYDRVMKLCPRCREYGWEKYGSNFLEEQYYAYKARPTDKRTSSDGSGSESKLAGVIGHLELGVDSLELGIGLYDNLGGDPIIKRQLGGLLPGSTGTGLVIAGVIAQNEFEGTPWGQTAIEIPMALAADKTVDGISTLVGTGVALGIAGMAPEASPLAAPASGVITFIAVNVQLNKLTTPYVESASETIYNSIPSPDLNIYKIYTGRSPLDYYFTKPFAP
ncbi:MAG: RHS repeat-associated core domain-containing protein [Anaerolineales bacterium]|nr:RHS repeat-associated core domain-containing protein [Anaerolineales bacterium]